MHVAFGAVVRSPTLVEILVGVGSALFWCITYVLVIIKGFKDKTYGIPIAAICFNVVWEFIYTFVFRPTGTGFQFWIALLVNFLWFALDVVIVITWLKFWRSDYPAGFAPKLHLPMLLVLLATAAGVLIGIQLQFDGDPPGGISSFLQNLLMSALFCAMIGRRNSAAGQSIPIALSKLLGSALASTYFVLTGFTTIYWVTLFVLIFSFDVIYTLMVSRKLVSARRLAA